MGGGTSPMLMELEPPGLGLGLIVIVGDVDSTEGLLEEDTVFTTLA